MNDQLCFLCETYICVSMPGPPDSFRYVSSSMSTDTLALKRGANVYAIAAVCVITALMQLAAGLMVFKGAPSQPSSLPGQQFMTHYVVFSWGISTLLIFVAGVAVYLMRTAALAFMGYLLAHSLSRLVGQPVPLATVLGVPFYPVLIYFTIRMFEQSPAVRSSRLQLTTLLFVGMVAGHLTVLLRNVYAYPTLAAAGALSPVLVLAALVGCVAFYTAALTLTSRPERARKLFLFAALFTGLQLPAWGYRWGFAAPFWLEVPIALFGFALARQWSAWRHR